MLVDLKRIPGAKGICREGDVLKIGALTTLKELEEDQTVLTCAPILSEAARSVATPQPRDCGREPLSGCTLLVLPLSSRGGGKAGLCPLGRGSVLRDPGR